MLLGAPTSQVPSPAKFLAWFPILGTLRSHEGDANVNVKTVKGMRRKRCPRRGTSVVNVFQVHCVITSLMVQVVIVLQSIVLEVNSNPVGLFNPRPNKLTQGNQVSPGSNLAGL